MSMKEHLSESIQPAFRSEDLKHIIEEAVGSRIPVATMGDHERLNELQARIAELEQRLGAEEAKLEAEISAKRAAENRAAEIDRELQSAATRIEVEMMNKSALNQRIVDLEDRVHHAEQQAEVEVKGRRAAEDRLSEVQRLLRISSEEEVRLRELVEEREQKIKSLESTQSKNLMRLTLLEANQANSHQAQGETQNRINTLEAEAREARKEAHHWRSETDRIVAIAQRRDKELAQALDENKALHKLIDTLGVQLQENEHVRDNWRSKFMTLQEEMARAAKEMAEEIARRTKKEQSLLGRQEVLEARLQAEARTRERIETELERLEMGERQGMRAVAECKRLEAALAEMRTENHKLHQGALRYQAEFQEARESAAREVQRTRDAMQTEVDNANHQVNVVREELEDQVVRLRAQLDNVKMDADTAKARHEMLLEEAQTSKQAELEELVRKHQNEIEDLQARYERQLSNTSEEAQRTEQNLLERLSISTSKWEHLQDKVAHLEEKLEIAKEAARAAAQAAKSAANSDPVPQPWAPAASRQLEPPEKISPQALRESIMVLQEQLQEREQRIEELEVKLSKTDPDAEIKISKRDDEITWLRELLAVRHSDLQDIIGALSRDDYDRNAVKDAAIRLKANLQMEEQERERAINGGSAINLPNIAATIRDAATPRVAQAVGPLAAAWGNWRKGRDLGSVLSSPAPASGGSSTPSRSNTVSNSLLGGLLTPPASGMRQTPLTTQAKQPTAFSSTGRRFTAQDLANRPRPQPPAASGLSKQEGKAPAQSTPPRRALSGPVTPPMMRPSAYDSDAHAEDFDDAGFFEDD
jgi:chromosome segregation ATPase